MELRMVDLVACCSGAAAAARPRFGAAGTVERLPRRTAAFTVRMDLGERICVGGALSGRIAVGEEKEWLGSGRVGGGSHGWRRGIVTTVRYVPRSNSVAEAPSSSEGLNLEATVSNQSEDVEAEVGKRCEQGGGVSSSEVKEEVEEEELEKGYKMSRICDRLIEVFKTERTTPAQWKNLLALSKEWIRIRPHFFKRCRTNAKADKDPVKKRELLQLARRVKEVDETMTRHNKLLADVEKNEFGIDLIVAKRRKEFTGDFFEHLQILVDVSPKVNRQDEIAAIAGKCLSVIEAYDAAVEDSEAISEAQLKFDDILNSPSLESASNKINRLARSKELDSTLLLLITKTWATAKDSSTMKQEVKDIMFHLYNEAKTSMLKLVPDEIRIIKYLLAIPDPRERFAAMTKSFAPGDDLEEKFENRLHTSPDKLRHWIKLVLDAYHSNKQNTMIKEAQKLMNPQVITRLEMLLEFMDDQFV